MEIKVKSTLRFHLTIVRMAKIKNNDNQCYHGSKEKGHLFIAGGNIICFSHIEISLAVSHKAKNISNI